MRGREREKIKEVLESPGCSIDVVIDKGRMGRFRGSESKGIC